LKTRAIPESVTNTCALREIEREDYEMLCLFNPVALHEEYIALDKIYRKTDEIV
jgi:hypothetical protein